MGRFPFYVGMTQLKQLVTRAEAYAKKAGLAQSTVSRKVFLDSSRLADLKDGSRMFPETMDACARRLAKLERELERDKSRRTQRQAVSA
jgi:hypothetical protein